MSRVTALRVALGIFSLLSREVAYQRVHFLGELAKAVNRFLDRFEAGVGLVELGLTVEPNKRLGEGELLHPTPLDKLFNGLTRNRRYVELSHHAVAASREFANADVLVEGAVAALPNGDLFVHGHPPRLQPFALPPGMLSQQDATPMVSIA